MLPDERRMTERRLKELRAYDGFTCAIELSFDMGQRAYIFELRTDFWRVTSWSVTKSRMGSPVVGPTTGPAAPARLRQGLNSLRP